MYNILGAYDDAVSAVNTTLQDYPLGTFIVHLIKNLLYYTTIVCNVKIYIVYLTGNLPFQSANRLQTYIKARVVDSRHLTQ